MVDRKVKKNQKPKPTPPEALYQVLVYLLYHNIRYPNIFQKNVLSCTCTSILTVRIMDLFVNTALVTTLLLFIVHYWFVFSTQDPSTIEHEMEIEVDKPKRSSKKNGGPDVVPPSSEGVSG